ncbi:MAG: xanthine dehydrogenase molybdopterin binding subunit, partial [Psychrobacter sp.]|nr:xanthine dehydrogenase molybdopterin binding subunit [Psychrobacter sp.]
PKQWQIKLFDRKNSEQTIYNSKAVGEPPFMLAASVWCAINNAIASLKDYQQNPELTMPATPEAILKAVMQLQGEPWEIDPAADKSAPLETDSDLKTMPEQVRHAEDINPPKVVGKLIDEDADTIEHPNVAGARGPAHSE